MGCLWYLLLLELVWPLPGWWGWENSIIVYNCKTSYGLQKRAVLLQRKLRQLRTQTIRKISSDILRKVEHFFFKWVKVVGGDCEVRNFSDQRIFFNKNCVSKLFRKSCSADCRGRASWQQLPSNCKNKYLIKVFFSYMEGEQQKMNYGASWCLIPVVVMAFSCRPCLWSKLSNP